MPRHTGKPKLLLFCLAIAALLLLLLPVLVSASPSQSKDVVQDHPHSRRHLREIALDHCEGTLYPSLCVSTVVAIPNLTSKNLPEIMSAVIDHTKSAVHYSASDCTSVLREQPSSSLEALALSDCLELFQHTLDDLHAAMSVLAPANMTRYSHDDLQTLLSAAITNQYTCLDGFAYASNRSVRDSIEDGPYHISHLVSNSLAMSKKLPGKTKIDAAFEGNGKARGGGFPTWLTRKDRRLLHKPVAVTKIDLVVAKDGTGDFTTICEAVAAAPKYSKKRFVIYIKAAGYYENVEIPSNMPNLMFIGEGMWKTVVKARRNKVDGWTTFKSATVAVSGKGFLARDMTFQNSAGRSKHQAVALRSSSDHSAFYRCSFAGYQDTLYVHSFRQFYRDCDVYGTVDFIFGNAAVVLQNCNLYARKPKPKQKNIFTAQGRQDPNQNTGISIQNCKVAAAADLIPVQGKFKTYLGRPWRQYSRTVFMTSYLGDLIDPAGWLEWSGDYALSTLYYGEYSNRGPGSYTTRRVTWPGYRVIDNPTEAAMFTPQELIKGDHWLPRTTIPYALS